MQIGQGLTVLPLLELYKNTNREAIKVKKLNAHTVKLVQNTLGAMSEELQAIKRRDKIDHYDLNDHIADEAEAIVDGTRPDNWQLAQDLYQILGRDIVLDNQRLDGMIDEFVFRAMQQLLRQEIMHQELGSWPELADQL